ncbi:MAG: PD-(D/E)XK nuclease family protein [Candidatus Omnitrophica bacterium]|nr:PD-(D/E)XK nuclease family protein [Candidatus Omnitrophota bacterium]
MQKIKTFHFKENFIKELAIYLKADFNLANDLSRTAIVFGGKRPALFLKKELAEIYKNSFIPPSFFSINEFMKYIVSKNNKFSTISEIEACFTIYSLAKTKVPEVLKTYQSFSQFMPWAREIVLFIDQLDLEDISMQRLLNIEENAEIGYEVPPVFNKLLENIVTLRELYHLKMKKDNKYSRGLVYLSAAENCRKTGLDEFDKILFCNFFELHNTEKLVIKEYYDKDKAAIFFQKDNKPWAQFEELAAFFKAEIKPKVKLDDQPDNLRLYAGFDAHSQVGIIREILKKIANPENTVIVLPQEDSLIPLLSEISSVSNQFNVSMGYPLRRSTLYNLFDRINRAQKTRKRDQYYAKDYLALIMHPLIKNMLIDTDSAITRVLVHKIEEVLSGGYESELGGSLFIGLSDLVEMIELHVNVSEQLKSMSIIVSNEQVKCVLNYLHKQVFLLWEKINTLGDFARVLEGFIDLLVSKSAIAMYPLNLKMIEKMLSLSEQFKNKAISTEPFAVLEIFKIFDGFLRKEKIAFSGAPLKGLQILGFLETRALSFENVIVMDVNESVLPKLSTNEPLVPRAILISLGLDRLEEEECIQRYQFMRLIKSAKNVHLVYNDSADKQRSRFIEEIIWEQEKANKKLNNDNVPRAAFNCEIIHKKGMAKKNTNIQELLDNFTFSASSLNLYLKCPLQFYYKYILGLSEKEDLLDELESKEVGTFIHKLLEDMFLPFLSKSPNIDLEFKNFFFNEFDKRFEHEFKHRMKSDAFMIEQIMRFRLEKFLENEQQRQIQRIEGLETDIKKIIKLNRNKQRSISFKCRIDRIDCLEKGRLLIIDYKTGNSDSLPAGLKTLEKVLENPDRKAIKKTLKSFQLPLYLYCVEQDYADTFITAALYNIRTLNIDEFPKLKEYAEKDQIMQCCLDMLAYIIDEIYDLDKPFEADNSEDSCKYCQFKSLCP